MSQSRLHSFIESCTNVALGLGVNLVANIMIFPLFGWRINWRQNLALGAIFTLISIARSFVLRRVFNRWHVRVVA